MTSLSDKLASTGASVPGTVIASSRSSPPTGYLLCDGSAVSRTTYAKLFAAVGTTFGVGDGSTTFNLPNTSGLFLRGAGSQTFSSKTFDGGAVGNKQADTTAVNGLSASTVSTPSLSLSNTDLTHTHSYNDLTTTSFVTFDDGEGGTGGILTNPTNAIEADTTGSALGSHSHTITPSITSVVTSLSGSAAVVKPGSLSVCFFIKV